MPDPSFATSTRRVVLAAGLGAVAWRLTRPAAAAPSPTADGFWRMEAAPHRLSLAPPPAEAASALAYAGQIPGPPLRVKRGDDLKVRLANRLAEPTMLCFPGLRPPNASAGYGGLTTPRLKPGESLDIRFAPPDAGFNLYLPHAGATDAGQQGRGLFGPIIVDEPEKLDVDEDFVVILSDWNLDDKGQIKDDFSDPALLRGAGRRGALIFANGVAAPLKLSARPGARIRLRIGNAATARLAAVAIEGAKTLIVAVDGQPSDPFEPLRNQFPMGPGARFELLFDMPRGKDTAVNFALRGAGEAETPFIAIKGEGEPAAERGALGRLPPNPLLPAEIALENGRRTDIVVTGGGGAPFALNGATFKDWSPKPVAALARNAVSVFALANRTAVVQSLRLGGHAARILHSMDDGWEPYWRDTILVQPGRTISIAFVASNPGKWPIESSIPEHRAAGVGGWFSVG